jgi:hypothetical protein
LMSFVSIRHPGQATPLRQSTSLDALTLSLQQVHCSPGASLRVLHPRL